MRCLPSCFNSFFPYFCSRLSEGVAEIVLQPSFKLQDMESVSYIGDWAFRKCSHISEAVSLTTAPAMLGTDLGGTAFTEFGTQTLTVPCGCVEAYQNSQWYDPIGLNGFYEFIEDCTGVFETDAVSTAVYPNPTQGKVTIEAAMKKPGFISSRLRRQRELRP